MEVTLGNSDGWVRREVLTPNDCSPLRLLESRGGKNLEEILGVAILNLRRQSVVRATVMEYFTEAYIGGEIKYAEAGDPATPGLIVELDFDPTQPPSFFPPKPVVTKDYGGNNEGIFGKGDRDRIKFPESWIQKGDKVVFEVEVRTKEGEWILRSLAFPARMTVEMLKNSARKKLTGLAGI